MNRLFNTSSPRTRGSSVYHTLDARVREHDISNQRKFFNNPAHRYPHALNPPIPQRLEMEALEKALGRISGKNILDFGAGSGRVTFWFLKKGYNVTALDISQESLRDLTKPYRKFKTPSWGKLTITSVFPQKTFDAVVGADILHHVNIQEYLPKLMRILKPSGRIAFSEPNAWFLPWYMYIFIRRLPWSIENGIVHMTPYRLRHAFHQAGYTTTGIRGFPKFIWFRLIVSA